MPIYMQDISQVELGVVPHIVKLYKQMIICFLAQGTWRSVKVCVEVTLGCYDVRRLVQLPQC